MTAAATRRPPDSRKDEGFCDRRPTAHVAEISLVRSERKRGFSGPLQARNEARRIPARAAHRLNLGVELIDQGRDGQGCAIAARFFQAEGEILAHPIHRETEVEFSCAHGFVAVVHLPGLRRALADDFDGGARIEPRALGEMKAFGQSLNEPGNAESD